jgi:hypothetical protein
VQAAKREAIRHSRFPTLVSVGDDKRCVE